MVLEDKKKWVANFQLQPISLLKKNYNLLVCKLATSAGVKALVKMRN